MAFGVKANRIVTFEEKDADLSRAKLSFQHSESAFDESNARFHVTLDKLVFKSIYDIVTKLIGANGYILNIENILSTLDTCRFGISGAGTNLEETIVVKSYTPCMGFEMPSSSRKGNLLQLFYSEIESYERMIQSLDGKQTSDEIKNNQKKLETLEREIAQLRVENNSLKREIGALSEKLNESNRKSQGLMRAAETGQVLPDGIRLGQVKGIDMSSRTLDIRVKRSGFHFPMAKSNHVLNVGDRCLVRFDDGMASEILPLEKSEAHLTKVIGRVLHKASNKVKVRFANRSSQIVVGRNEAEDQLISDIDRGDVLLFELFDSEIIRFSKCKGSDNSHLSSKVSDELARGQIIEMRQEYDEEIIMGDAS